MIAPPFPFSADSPIGFIGLGRMGAPMAANLVKAGYRTIGFDTDPSALAAARVRGVRTASSAHEVLAEASTLLLSLPNEEAMENLVTGPHGLRRGGFYGKVLIDTTTTTVATAQRVAAAVAEAGGAFLDAPVTGGVGGAGKGTLTIMVGGDETVYRDRHSVLAALGSNVVHIGPSGHGQVAKLVNQMLMAAIYVSVAEAFAFAARLGADVKAVYDAVENGGGRSALLSGMRQNLLAGVTSRSHNLEQHGKDIDYAMAEAARCKFPLPLTANVHAFYQMARAMGFDEISSGEMWAVWEKLYDLKLTDTIRTPPAKPAPV